jgi:hypothetical protein
VFVRICGEMSAEYRREAGKINIKNCFELRYYNIIRVKEIYLLEAVFIAQKFSLHGYYCNWFLMIPSIATKFQYVNSFLFSFSLTTYFGPYGPSSGEIYNGLFLIQRIRCTYVTWCRDVTCCTSAPWLCIPNTCYYLDINIKVVDIKL